MATLVPLRGADAGWPLWFPLRELEIFIGRLPECQVCSTDESVSRRHARLVFHEGQWWVEDLGSRNGVMVNGQSIQSCILPEEAIVRVGDQYFVFTAGDFTDEETVRAWRVPYVEKAEQLHAATPIPPGVPPNPASGSGAAPVVSPQKPMPPVAPVAAMPSFSTTQATRAYPARTPENAAKVSAMLGMPGALAAPVRTAAVPIAPATPHAGGNSGLGAGTTVKSLQVTGPDYGLYIMIGLAVVILIGALVVFFVQRAKYEKAQSEAAAAALWMGREWNYTATWQ